MKKQQIINELSKYLNSYQIIELLKKQTGLTKNQLFFCEDLEIKQNDIEIIKQKLEKNIPYEYIINKSEFYSLDFYVDSRVLIPRNDTEIMVDQAIKEINKQDKVDYIDIWTGSSCIAISIIKNIDNKKLKSAYAFDLSDKALEISNINIQKHKINNLKIIKSDLLEKYPPSKNIKIITANLPYIKNYDYKNMSIQTINNEPEIALYGWEKTWFEIYERLIEQCIKIWNIILFIEIWFDQKEYSKKHLEAKKLNYKYYKDNSWIDRCIKINF